MSDIPTKINVLELFSGIGGMHFSLCRAQEILSDIYGDDRSFDFKVVQALDISELANEVYYHNFPSVATESGNICGLKADKLSKLNIHAIFMSPPCQPFTRQGLQKDLQDSRTQPLVHICNEIIPNISSVKYVLVENVKGFETSESRNLLVSSLKHANFDYQEFLLSPTQFGIPNSRLRYYLIAKRRPEKFYFETKSEIISDLEAFQFSKEIGRFFDIGKTQPLQEFLSCTDENDFAVPDTVLKKYSTVIDIVRADDTNCCCFTKAYTKYSLGTGSVIQEFGGKYELDAVFSEAEICRKEGKDELPTLRRLKLRYFTPKEILKILGFPASGPTKFEIPSKFNGANSQMYRLLGNSLSVTVVSFLAANLFLDVNHH